MGLGGASVAWAAVKATAIIARLYVEGLSSSGRRKDLLLTGQPLHSRRTTYSDLRHEGDSHSRMMMARISRRVSSLDCGGMLAG